jgi:acyl-[acyl carrier protein]--UDP-N-acetylglucosamine O-acyltransferase
LRRAGITASDRLELKQLYRELFRSGRDFRTALSEAQKKFHSDPARVMLDFIARSKRGVCFDATRHGSAGLEED